MYVVLELCSFYCIWSRLVWSGLVKKSVRTQKGYRANWVQSCPSWQICRKNLARRVKFVKKSCPSWQIYEKNLARRVKFVKKILPVV